MLSAAGSGAWLAWRTHCEAPACPTVAAACCSVVLASHSGVRACAPVAPSVGAMASPELVAPYAPPPSAAPYWDVRPVPSCSSQNISSALADASAFMSTPQSSHT